MDQNSHHDDVGQIDEVKREIDTLRERTQSVAMALQDRLFARKRQVSDLVGQLKRATDVRMQIKRHPVAASSTGTATLLGAGLVAYLAYRRWKRERSLGRRIARRAHAYRALLADPERALRPRNPVGKRLLGAVLSAAATAVTQALVKWAFAKSARQQPRTV
jgi:hypothetical protein